MIAGLLAIAHEERRESARADEPGSMTQASAKRRVDILETAAARLRALLLACGGGE